MATPIRPYLVTNTATGVKRLIQATNQAQARNFVARSQYAVEVVSASEIITLMSAGMKAETATDEPVVSAKAKPLDNAGMVLPHIPSFGDMADSLGGIGGN